MCGISGAFNRFGKPVSEQVMQAMVDAIAHRGPDHNSVYCDGPVGLGYARLSILDLSPSGNQPMFDQSGDWVAVYNGEVYNFQELREELSAAGVRFRSHCDTEVVVNLFAREGIAALSRLNGMFALAIWCRAQRRLWVARDPIGVKPLYYRVTPRQITFSSEMKSIHQAEPALPPLSARGILNYLSFGHSVAPETIFDGIYKLPPGCCLQIHGADLELIRYFEYPVPAEENGRSDASWIEECETILQQAVRRQMIADVPVGVFLSGGIDSGLVTACMAKESRAVHAFSIGFSGHGSYNEVDAAAQVARHLGAEHHPIHVNEDDLIQSLDKMVYHFDEPFADAAGLPVYLLSRFAVNSVKVALSGEGGDELFGGYRRYVAEKHARWELLPKPVRTAISSLGGGFGRAWRIRRILQSIQACDAVERYAGLLAAFGENELEALVAENLRKAARNYDQSERYRPLFANCRGVPVVSKLAYADAQTWLVDTYLEKVDKMSMAVSLEVRVPLLDLELVRFAARCPDNLKVRGMTSKYILRKIAARILPKGFSSRPKHGLSVPTDPWFRGRLKSFARDCLLDGRLAEEGILNRAAVSAILDRHATGRRNCESQIWVLLMFEQWARRLPSCRLSITD